jgi:segregation and condensation protein B
MSERENDEELIDEESIEDKISIEREVDEVEIEKMDLDEPREGSLTEEDEELDFEDLEDSATESDEDLTEEGREEAEELELEEDEVEKDLEGEEGETESEEGEIGDAEAKKPPTEEDIRQISKNLIEGALYASGSPLDIEELSTKLEMPKKITEELVNELAFEYLERDSALIIAQVGEKWQMQLKPEYTEQVSKFAKGGGIAEKYLRTLTVIALKQPILKSLLVKLRGSGAYEHVKYLIDNDLISAVKKGRTHELTTTDKYSEMFGLPKEMAELKRVMISQLGVEPEIQRED